MIEITEISQAETCLKTNDTDYLLIVFYVHSNNLCDNIIQLLERWHLLLNSELVPKWIFSKVDSEKCLELCNIYKITSVPTVIMLSKSNLSEPIFVVEGYNPISLASEINSKCKINFPFKKHILSEKLIEKFDGLIKRSPLMLFIKGTPDSPCCGFTRQLISLLYENQISRDKFDYFDILSDEDVRQGLKIYSDWPTFPQIYIHGELVGGLDILKEMLSSDYKFNEFKS